MYTVNLEYEDGKMHQIKHITKIKYMFNGLKTISEDEMLTHHFQFAQDTLCNLYSQNGIYACSTNGLRFISIEKEI